jgi:hypothetical protein
MMAQNGLTVASKLKRTITWTLLILGSSWLLAACAGSGGYGTSSENGPNYLSAPVPGASYDSPGYLLHGPHSDYSPDLP